MNMRTLYAVIHGGFQSGVTIPKTVLLQAFWNHALTVEQQVGKIPKREAKDPGGDRENGRATHPVGDSPGELSIGHRRRHHGVQGSRNLFVSQRLGDHERQVIDADAGHPLPA